MMSAVTVAVVDAWAAELDRLHARIAGRFRRAEPRARVRQYLCGLAAGLQRKNGWTLAERAGEVSPDGMQRLLRWADWDVEAVRDDLRDYLIEHLGDPQGVLIVDTHRFTSATRHYGPRRDHGRPLRGQSAALVQQAHRATPPLPAIPRRTPRRPRVSDTRHRNNVTLDCIGCLSATS